MDKRTQLKYIRKNSGFVVHAHPFREADYIDHIRLYPNCIDGVKVINASRTEHENRMAGIFAKEYGFASTAGSDNHTAGKKKELAGMEFESPLQSEYDFIERLRNREGKVFTLNRIDKTQRIKKRICRKKNHFAANPFCNRVDCYTSPCAVMASATFIKPAAFAPNT